MDKVLKVLRVHKVPLDSKVPKVQFKVLKGRQDFKVLRVLKGLKVR